jgi:membrane-associated protease RseP (regulator of RpoE activity)
MSESDWHLTAGLAAEIREAISKVFDIDTVTMGKSGDPALRFQGRFLVPPDFAYEQLGPYMRQLGLTVIFRREEAEPVILLFPGTLTARASRIWPNIVLLILTLLSTLFVGAMMVTDQPSDFLRHPWIGLPFAISLMTILGAHELGHYFTAKRYGVPVTLPYFIPMPFGPFGTLGAFISMKAPPPNRRALLSIAAAGPIAGFILAVPILLIGLSMSTVTLLNLNGNAIMEGNSILYALLKVLTFGRFLPSGGEDVFLHPVAFAGWAGLLVTGLNLLPVGQLDGGHIVYALLGRKAQYLVWPVIIILLGLGTLWTGWFLWAALMIIFGRRHAAPMDDLTPLTFEERVVGWAAIALFFMVFTPLPMSVY